MLLCCRLEPEPVEPIEPGARVAFFSTGRPAGDPAVRWGGRARAGRLLAQPGPSEPLALDLERAGRERCDVYVTEFKAAAIDTVAERAARTALRVVFVRNLPRARRGEPDLDEALLAGAL